MIRESSNEFRVIGTGYEIVLTVTSHLNCRVAFGETNPPLGWFSPVLGEKIPSPTIIASGNVIGFDNMFTEFTVNNLNSATESKE